MQAVKIEATVPGDRQLLLKIPAEIPAGEVEILILAKEPVPDNRHLMAFLDELEQLPPSPRSPQAIEADIQAERNGWE